MENKRCVKHKAYSVKLKKEILKKHYENNITSTTLAKEYNIPRNTIKNWFDKTNRGINVLVDRRPQGSGRIPETEAGYKERYEIVKKMEKFLKELREKKPSL